MSAEDTHTLYRRLLSDYVTQPTEAALQAAADLGRELMQVGMPPEGVAELHHLALSALAKQHPELFTAAAVEQTAALLIEMLMTYGLAFREQMALRERLGQANLEAVTEQSQDMVVITDTHGRVEYVNPAFLAATGYSFEECKGSTPADLVKSGRQSDAIYRELWQSIESGKSWQGPLINRDRSGKLFVVDSSIFPLRDYQGQIKQYVAIARDITERVAMERSMQEKTQRLEGIATLAAGIAHDANNLLGMILGYADLVAADVTDTLTQSNLEQIKLAATHSRDLVGQILAFGRHNQRAEPPQLVPVLEVVQEIVALLKVSCSPNVQLTVRTKTEQPEAIVAIRRGQLTQVLMNLALNALQAMGMEDGQLDIEIEHLGTPPAGLGLELHEAGYVCIHVNDNGPGIPEALQQRIFDPFFTTKNAEEGTGLGLSVTKNIIDRYQGAVTLWSEPGKGSRFSVLLPQADEDALTHIDTSPKSRPAPATKKQQSVALIVDDDRSQLNLIKRMADKASIQTLVIDDPWEALKIFHHNPKRFFAVVTDHFMPELSGLRMAQHMLDVNPKLFVILCTASPEKIDRRGIEVAGIVELMVKPLNYGDLMQRLRTWQDQHTAES